MIRALITLLIFLVLATALDAAVHISTCKVKARFGRRSQGGTGSKIAMDDKYDYVITAAHVILRGGRVISDCSIRYLPYASLKARVVEHDTRPDIAILTTRRTGVSFHPLVQTSIGTKLWAEGLTSGRRSSQLLHRRSSHRGVVWGTFAGLPKDGDSGGPLRNAANEPVAVLHHRGGGSTSATETNVILAHVSQPLRITLQHGDIRQWRKKQKERWDKLSDLIASRLLEKLGSTE